MSRDAQWVGVGDFGRLNMKQHIILPLIFFLGLELGLVPSALAEPNDLVLLTVKTANLRTEKEMPPASAALAGLIGIRNLPKLGRSMDASKPDRPLLRIEFSSHVNLPLFAFGNGYTLSSQAYFCDDPEASTGRVKTIADPGVYANGTMLTAYDPSPLGREKSPYIYYMYVFLDGRLTYNGQEKVKEFYDLRQSPQDVCLKVRGGKNFSSFESNILIIQKGEIARILNGARRRK